MIPSNENHRRRRNLKPWLWLAAAACVIVVLWNLPVGDCLRGVLEWLRGAAVYTPVVFCLLYAVSALLLIPGSLLTLAAGWMFGFWQGALLVSIAANAAATLAFVISRHWARAPVKRLLARRPVVAAIDDAVTQDGWKMVTLLRLSPVIPFTVLNYVMGISGVKMRVAMIGTFIGMIPGTLMYVYMGSMSEDAVYGRNALRPKSAGEWTLQGFGLLVTIFITLRITHRAKAVLQERLGDSPRHHSSSMQ